MADPVIPPDMSIHRAVFTKSFGTPSTPDGPGFHAFPGDEPQSFPRRFIEAAIRAGCAEPVAKIRRKASAEDSPPVADPDPAPPLEE